MCSARQDHFEWTEMIERLPVPAYALDVEGRVAAWNEPLSRLVGVGRDEMIGHGSGLHAVPFIGKPDLMLADLALAPSLLVPDHLVGLRRDGLSITALLSSVAMEPARQLRVLASSILAGDRCMGAVEVILQPDSSEERMLSSLGIFDRLMGIVRHDVLNQLTIVLGYIELARDGIEDPVPNADLDRAVAAAETIRHHMEMSRDFRQIGTRKPVERSLIELVAAATEQAEVAGVRIETRLPEIGVCADPLLVRLLEHFVNLSIAVEPAASVIRFEVIRTDPLVIRYGDDTVDGRWKPQANGLPREMAPMLLLAQDVIGLDGISVSFTGDPNNAAEISLPRTGLRP